MDRGYKEEITHQLSSETAVLFSRWIAGACAVWNASVARNKIHYQAWQDAGKPRGAYPVEDKKYAWVQDIAEGDRDYRWLKGAVPPGILRNARDLWHKEWEACRQGLRGSPKFKGQHDRRSIWITREMLDVSVENEHLIIRILSWGKKDAATVFYFKKSWPKENSLPASVRIRKQGRRFWLSFSYQQKPDEDQIAPEALLAGLGQLSEEELEGCVVGLDRGVRKVVATSRKEFLHTPEDEAARMAQKERRKLRWQRIVSRRKKGSANRAKARAKLGKQHAKIRNVRFNRAHHISKALVEDKRNEVLAFEELKTKNMTRSAKGTADEPGRNVKAKAGLNRAILGSMWGQIKTFASYKALERGKLAVGVPPANSSRECPRCGHIHKDNRHGDRFECRQCGHQDDADINAGVNLRGRAISMILDGTLADKMAGASKKKKTLVARRKPKANNNTTARTAESNACGEPVRPSPGMARLVWKQESRRSNAPKRSEGLRSSLL